MSSKTQYIGTFCTTLGTSVFGFVTMNNGVPTYKYFNTSDHQPYLGEILENCNGTSTSNSDATIKVLNKNSYSDIQKIHGFINVGNGLIATNRGLSAPGGQCKIVYYPDYNDLQNKVILLDYGNFNLESICYSPVTNKIYVPLSGSIFLNVIDLSTYAVAQYTPLPGMETFGGSCPIVTDDTHLYIATESGSNKFYKILMSNMTLVATTVWTNNIHGAHSGVINKAKTEAYFAGGTGAWIAKLNLANMTYVDLKLDIGGNCDDMAYIPNDVLPDSSNLVVLCQENHSVNAGTIVNMDTMLQYTIPLMGGSCMYFSEVTNKIYNLTINGSILTYDLLDIVNYLDDPSNADYNLINKYKVYKSSLNDVVFNEMQITDDGKIFVTDWSDKLEAKILEIEFIEKDNPYVIEPEKKLYHDNYLTKVKTIDSNYRLSMDDNRSYLVCINNSINVIIPTELPLGFTVVILTKDFGIVTILNPLVTIPYPIGGPLDGTAVRLTKISENEIFIEKINF